MLLDVLRSSRAFCASMMIVLLTCEMAGSIMPQAFILLAVDLLQQRSSLRPSIPYTNALSGTESSAISTSLVTTLINSSILPPIFDFVH